MIIKQLVDEDFINYKKAAMFIGFPTCDWKCEKDCGLKGLCQNSELFNSPEINISIDDLVSRYQNNPITSAFVFGGLEPFDSFDDLHDLVKTIRIKFNILDDIVIYTGYYKNEIIDKLYKLAIYDNIIIKYGRFIPNQKSHYDNILGINLASDNQYAEKLIFKVEKTDMYDDVKNKVDTNDGYCPCRLDKISDNKCMCKEFRDQIKNKIPGECHCGMYILTI